MADLCAYFNADAHNQADLLKTEHGHIGDQMDIAADMGLPVTIWTGVFQPAEGQWRDEVMRKLP